MNLRKIIVRSLEQKQLSVVELSIETRTPIKPLVQELKLLELNGKVFHTQHGLTKIYEAPKPLSWIKED